MFRTILLHRLPPTLHRTRFRLLHTTKTLYESSSAFTNILAGDTLPPVQVNSITPNGIQLANGLVIPSACIFLEGKVFLWDVPSKLWQGWGKEHLEVFEIVMPRPEILLLGTGKNTALPPPFFQSYLNGLGIRVDTMDTRNACSTYNLLAEEGRRVAAALIPYHPFQWQKIRREK